MKILHSIIIIATVYIFCGCQTRNVSSVEGSEIPKLLIRNQVIGPEEEMGYIIDTYNKLAEKIKSNPHDVEARLSLVELFMQEARISGEHGYYYPEALKVIEGVMNDQPKEALKYRALLDKASVLLSLHQFKAAKEIGEEALTINPHSADAYGVLVDANVELGAYEKAIEMADKMVSIRPDLRSYSRVSYLREIHGDVNGAIEAMKLAVAAGYPGMEQTEWARLTLGHLYERYGSQDSAMMQYEMALSARPHFPFAIHSMAAIFAAKGDYKSADSLNALASHLIPEVSFFMDRAMWEKERGNIDKVNSMTKEILGMLADDESAGHSMSLEFSKVYLHLLGDQASALKYAQKEFQLRPDNIDVNLTLAEIYFHQGDMENSRVHLNKAIRTGSKDPVTRCLDGILLTKFSQKTEGENLLKQLFAEIPYLDCSYCKEARSIII